MLLLLTLAAALANPCGPRNCPVGEMSQVVNATGRGLMGELQSRLAAEDWSGAQELAHEMANRVRIRQDAGRLSSARAEQMLQPLQDAWNTAQAGLDAQQRTSAPAQRTTSSRSDSSSSGSAAEPTPSAPSSAPASGSNTSNTPSVQNGAIQGVPYFYQYNNKRSPKASCQNSSVAMLLGHYGVQITPDTITAEWGKDYAQSPEGLAKVFNHYAAKAGIPERLKSHREGSLSDIQRQLSEGDPAIVHGFFTDYGHVLVATGYNGSSYTVNDPAGRWSGSFKGGYGSSGETSGQGTSYGKSAFESAIASWDGGAPVAGIWWHEVVRP